MGVAAEGLSDLDLETARREGGVGRELSRETLFCLTHDHSMGILELLIAALVVRVLGY